MPFYLAGPLPSLASLFPLQKHRFPIGPSMRVLQQRSLPPRLVHKFEKSAVILITAKNVRGRFRFFSMETDDYDWTRSGMKLATWNFGPRRTGVAAKRQRELPATGSSQWISATFHDGACCREAQR
jgi:hypothetical protein